MVIEEKTFRPRKLSAVPPRHLNSVSPDVTPDKSSILLSILRAAADAGPGAGPSSSLSWVGDSWRRGGEALPVRVPELLEYLD